MKDVREDELFRLSLKPELTPDEQARLDELLAAPPARAVWEEDRALGRALHSLPDVPVSSNFTARVLQELDLEQARAQRTRRTSGFGWLRAFWPRFAGVTAAVALSVFIWQTHRNSKRLELAHDASFVSQDFARLPDADVLRDFDAIDSMRQSSAPAADELYLALQ